MSASFPPDRAPLLRAIRVFVSALNTRTGRHEDLGLHDQGRKTLPNGIDLDEVVAGLLAYDEELRSVAALEPDSEQDDLQEILSELRLLIGTG